MQIHLNNYNFNPFPINNNFFYFNNFFIFFWEDEEEIKNLLDVNVLCKLFQDLTSYTGILIKDLTLNDIYYSKKYDRFIIKNFETFIPFHDLNLSQNLDFVPKNILFNKCLYRNIEKELTYEDIINLSPNKHNLQNYFIGEK